VLSVALIVTASTSRRRAVRVRFLRDVVGRRRRGGEGEQLLDRDSGATARLERPR